jgi:hypothetical protein
MDISQTIDTLFLEFVGIQQLIVTRNGRIHKTSNHIKDNAKIAGVYDNALDEYKKKYGTDYLSDRKSWTLTRADDRFNKILHKISLTNAINNKTLFVVYDADTNLMYIRKDTIDVMSDISNAQMRAMKDYGIEVAGRVPTFDLDLKMHWL